MYRELGLKIVSLEEKKSLYPKNNPMEEEKRDNGAIDPIKLFLMESLVQLRNEMMTNFSHILQWIPTTIETPSTNNHFRVVTPFKVQVNLDIPLFEG